MELRPVEQDVTPADILTEQEMQERSSVVINRINQLLWAGPDGTLDKKLLPEHHVDKYTSDRLDGLSSYDASPWIDLGAVPDGVVQVQVSYRKEKVFLAGAFNDRRMMMPLDRPPFPSLRVRKRDFVVPPTARYYTAEAFRVDTTKSDEQKLLFQGSDMPVDRVVWDQLDLALDAVTNWRNAKS
jgi:hypothetical protein